MDTQQHTPRLLQVADCTLDPTDTLPRSFAVRIEKLRLRLFQAMAFVETTERALEHDEQISERHTLQAAYKVLDGIASEMSEISGIIGPIEEARRGRRGTLRAGTASRSGRRVRRFFAVEPARAS